MNAAIPTPQSGTSAQRLARLLGRRDCVLMPSASLALLSVFVAGRTRPTRLLVQRSAPAFVANLGKLSGAVCELVPDDDSEDLRAVLRSVPSGATGVWAVADPSPGSLTSPEWFASCEARGLPTIELIRGGLFDLARGGRSPATVTIVSLDHEPAFEGVHLTALLTDDKDLAQRVNQMCLPGSGSGDFVLDAVPRGLGEDEDALKTLIDRAIERHGPGTPAESVDTAPAKKSFSLAWKRVFRSEVPDSGDGPRPGAEDLTPPRGRNSWLARMAEVERRQTEAVRQAQAEAEEARLLGAEQMARLQSALEGTQRQLGETRTLAEKRAEEMARALERAREQAAAAVSEENATLAASVDRAEKETVRLRKEVEGLQAQEALSTRRHEAERDELSSRIDEVEKERDNLQTHLKSVLAERQRDAALQTVSVATAEKTRLALVARTDELEEAVARAQARIASLEEQAAQLTLLSASAASAREAAAAQLLQDAASHKDTLRLAEEREATLRREHGDETARLTSLVSEWQTRFDAAGRVAAKETQRRESQHAAQMARLQDEVAHLRQQAEATALAESQNAAGVTARISELERGNAVLAAERDALLSRMAAAETASREALTRAQEQADRSQREKGEEVVRFNAAQAEWQTRFETASAATAQQSERAREQHAEAVKSLEAELIRMNGVAAGLQARLDASSAIASREVERAEARHGEVVRQLESELARVNGATTEWQTRFDGAAAAAAKESERAEKRHAEVVRQLESELARVNGATTEWQTRFDDAALVAAKESERAEKRHGEVVRQLESELTRVNGSVTDWQTRFDAGATAAAQEVERLETRHAEIVEQLKGELVRGNAAETEASERAEKRHAEVLKQLESELGRLRADAEAVSDDHDRATAESSARIAVLEREGAALSSERDALELRLAQSEQRLREASQRFDERFATIERDKAEEISRLSAGLALGQARFDAAALAAANDARAREEEHHARVAGIQNELTQGRADREAKTLQLTAELAAFEKRIAVLDAEKGAVAAERDDLVARLAQTERMGQRAEQAAKGQIAALERGHLKETSRLAKTVASWQARFETANKNATREAQRVELRTAALVTRLQEKASQLKKQAGAAIRDQIREAAAFGKRLSVLERERDAAVLERDRTLLRLQELVEETTRLTGQVGEWQARFDTAAQSAVLESQRVEAQHAALVEGLREELARGRSQAEELAAERDRVAASLEARLKQLDGERVAALQAREESGARALEQEQKHAEMLRGSEERARLRLEEKAEELIQFRASVADWEVRFDAAAAAHGRDQSELNERLAANERDRAGAMAQRDEMQARWLQGEEKIAETLKRSEERFLRLQQETTEESKRLLGVAIEWQSRFDAAVTKHEQDQAELKERLVALEAERAEALKERDTLQVRWRQHDGKQAEIVEAFEKRHLLLQREKAEEATRQSATVAEFQARLDAAAAKRAQDQAELKARLVALDHERAGALKELDQLRKRARDEEERSKGLEETLASETARLNAALLEWQTRFDDATKAAERDSNQITAAHHALVARLREELAQLTEREQQPNDIQTATVAALNAQLAALKRAKTAAEEERKLIEVRLNQAGEAQRQAQRRADAALEEKAAEVVRLRETIQDWQARFDAASQAQAASTAALAERLKAMEKEKTTGTAELERAGQRLRQLEESHREALRSSEASRVEAETRLRSAEVRLAEVIATRSAGAEAAEVAAANLRAAVEARALESAAHAKALETWDAHRATLEAHIAGLERTLSPLSAALRHPQAVPLPRHPEGEARESGPAPKAARPLDNAGPSANRSSEAAPPITRSAADRRPGPKLVPWEYERILKGEREEKRNAVEDWRRSAPPRPPRD